MDLITTIGRLHPVLVHLPIGIFVTVLFLSFISMTEKYSYLSASVRYILVAGLVTAVLSLITGYILSLEGSNAENDVEIHKWTAIGMTVVYAAYYFFSPLLTQYKYPNLIALIVMLSALIITGHQGGSLTHGSDFLFASENSETTTDFVKPVITDISKANVYKDIVGYTLQTKCVECHGENKQKGKLRLDDPDWIKKGGKNGIILVNGEPDKSELIKRILLDDIDEHHMPPTEKTQLSPAEKNILSWWVKTGASFDASVESLSPDPSIKNDLDQFNQNLKGSAKSIKIRNEVSPADENTLKILRSVGWVIAPIATGDNHLRASGFNLEIPVDSAVSLLTKIKSQLIELKLGKTGMNDTVMIRLGEFDQLEKLWLENNNITDSGIKSLTNLKKLEFLNLSATGISLNGLKQLMGNQNLVAIYASGTKINQSDLVSLRTANSKTKIQLTDTLPFYPSDTMLFRRAN